MKRQRGKSPSNRINGTQVSDMKRENEPRRGRATGRLQRDKGKDRKMSKIWKKGVKGRITEKRKTDGQEKQDGKRKRGKKKKKNHRELGFGK